MRIFFDAHTRSALKSTSVHVGDPTLGLPFEGFEAKHFNTGAAGDRENTTM